MPVPQTVEEYAGIARALLTWKRTGPRYRSSSPLLWRCCASHLAGLRASSVPAPPPPILNLVSAARCVFQKVKPHQNLQWPPISIKVTQKAQKEIPPTTYLASFFSCSSSLTIPVQTQSLLECQNHHSSFSPFYGLSLCVEHSSPR